MCGGSHCRLRLIRGCLAGGSIRSLSSSTELSELDCSTNSLVSSSLSSSSSSSSSDINRHESWCQKKVPPPECTWPRLTTHSPFSRSGEIRLLMVLANCSREDRAFVNTWSSTCWVKLAAPMHTYFSHDGDGGHHLGLGHPVLHQVVHVLIVQQADEVKRAKAGGAAQSQVPNDHRTEEKVQHRSHLI